MNQSIKKQLNKIILEEIDGLLIENKVLQGLVGGAVRNRLRTYISGISFGSAGIKLSVKQVDNVLNATRAAFIRDKASKGISRALLQKAGKQTWAKATATLIQNPNMGPSAVVKGIISNSGNKLTQKEAMKLAQCAAAYRTALTKSVANTAVAGGEKIGINAAKVGLAGKPAGSLPAVVKPPSVPAVKPQPGVPAVKPQPGVPAVVKPPKPPGTTIPSGPTIPLGPPGGPLAIPGATGGALAIPQAAKAVWKFAGLSPLGYATCAAIGAATIYLIAGGDEDAAAKKIDDIPNMTPEQRQQAKEAMEAAQKAVLSGSIAAIDKLIETLKKNNPGGAFDSLIAWLEKKKAELEAAGGQGGQNQSEKGVFREEMRQFLADPSVKIASDNQQIAPSDVLIILSGQSPRGTPMPKPGPDTAEGFIQLVEKGLNQTPMSGPEIAKHIRRLREIAMTLQGEQGPLPGPSPTPGPAPGPNPPGPSPTPGPGPKPTPSGGGGSWRVKETTQFERVARRMTGLPTKQAVMKIQEMLVNAGFSVQAGGRPSDYGPDAEPLKESVIESNKSYKQISNAWKRFMIVSEARVPKSKFAEVGIDGYAGKETIAAVRAFQEAMIASGKNLGKYGPNKDGVDGIVGKYTYKVLQDVLAGKDKSIKPPTEKQPSADMKKKYPKEFPDTSPDAAGERMRQKTAADDITKADATASSREKAVQGAKGFVRAMNSWFRSSDNSYIRGMYNFIKANKDVQAGIKLQKSGAFWAALINVDKPKLKKIIGARFNKSPQLKTWAKNKVPKQLKDLASKYQSEMDQYTQDLSASLDSQEPDKIASDMRDQAAADASVYTNPKDKKPPRSAKYLFGRMEIVWEKAGGRVVKKGGKVNFNSKGLNPSTGKNYYTTFVLEPHGVPGRNYFGPGDGNVYAKRVRRLHDYFVKKFNISEEELNNYSQGAMKGLTDMLDNLPGEKESN